MIHRSRRQPAALPARRGMRAPWFRGRYAADPQRPPEATGATEAQQAEAGRAEAGRADPALVEPADATPGAEPATRTSDAASVAPVRPVHGHPTF